MNYHASVRRPANWPLVGSATRNWPTALRKRRRATTAKSLRSIQSTPSRSVADAKTWRGCPDEQPLLRPARPSRGAEGLHCAASSDPLLSSSLFPYVQHLYCATSPALHVGRLDGLMVGISAADNLGPLSVAPVNLPSFLLGSPEERRRERATLSEGRYLERQRTGRSVGPSLEPKHCGGFETCL